MIYTVRLLSVADADNLKMIRLRALHEEPQSFLEDPGGVERKDAKSYFDNGWIAGAFIDDRLVGTVGLYRHRGEKTQHKGTVWGVYVTPEMRGQGLARRMIELVLQEAKNAGLELIQISTDNTNALTKNLYQSLGFLPYGVEKHILKLAGGQYIDDVLMMMFLQ